MLPVITELASRYCPADKAIFLQRLGAIAIAGVAAALVCFLCARYSLRTPRGRELGYVGAAAIVAFVAGATTLVIYGLSGCGGGSEPGLTWDWPW